MVSNQLLYLSLQPELIEFLTIIDRIEIMAVISLCRDTHLISYRLQVPVQVPVQVLVQVDLFIS